MMDANISILAVFETISVVVKPVRVPIHFNRPVSTIVLVLISFKLKPDSFMSIKDYNN